MSLELRALILYQISPIKLNCSYILLIKNDKRPNFKFSEFQWGIIFHGARIHSADQITHTQTFRVL